MAKNNYRAHGDMGDSSSISRRGALGLAAAAAFSPLCSHAEEVDEVPVVGDLDLAVNADAPAESWRFSDGIPVESSEPGDGTSFYAAFEKWGKNESGAWVNSIGDPIPGALTRGVDVSEWQKNIDWAAVKADDISFAIVRAAKWAGTDSKGRPGVDVYWERNAVACERQGIPYGAYIYSYATTASEAIEEAEYLISLMRGHRPSYPLYIDLEDSRIANANLYEVAAAFCRRIERAGYRAGVYANLSWWNSKLSDPRIGSWSRWVAQYNVSCDYAGMKDIWQATSKGSIAGISGFVDLNFSYASLHDPGAGNVSWIRLHGQNHLDTMQSISQAGWKACRTVVIATNASYHDALAASALAGACGSPVLISNPSSLPSQTAAEIKRLGARTAVLVGGPTRFPPWWKHRLGRADVLLLSGFGVRTLRRPLGQWRIKFVPSLLFRRPVLLPLLALITTPLAFRPTLFGRRLRFISAILIPMPCLQIRFNILKLMDIAVRLLSAARCPLALKLNDSFLASGRF